MFSQDFYWVGGSGNWSDIAHWQSEVGGIPTISGNVFFTDSSFSANGEKVNIDVHAFCNNMDWSGASKKPRITGDSSLTIDGALVFHAGVKVQGKSEFHFTSSKPDQIIDFQGVVLNSNVYFNGTGSWNLQGDINILDSTFYLQSGTLDTKDHDIICGSFSSKGNAERTLALNSSTVYINGYHGFWDVTNKLVLQKGSSSIVFENPLPSSEAFFRGAALSYRLVEFRNHGIIRSSNRFDVLKLNAGNSYAFESGKTQTIVGNIIARGCSGLINIHPTASGQAIIRKPSGDVNISFVSLKSIEADMPGGGTFNANNSIDNGGNTNCNIYKNVRDLHWVNGTGLWSDTLHWNMVPPQGSDSRCVPVSYDNVFFDVNSFSSFDTIKVDLNSTYCHDMIWSSNQPVIFKSELDSSDMNIFGSLQFSNGIVNAFDGDFYFRDSTGNQTIDPKGIPFTGDIFFSGKGGWNILGQLTCKGNIYHNKGSVITQNHTIECASFISDSSHLRTLDIGSSTLIFNSSSSVPDFSLNNENLQLIQEKSTLIFEKPAAILNVFGGDTTHLHKVLFTSTDDIATIRNDTSYIKFNHALLSANAEILGNNSFDSLTFFAGNVYALQSGRIQTIVDGIKASGSCLNPLMIRSTRNGYNAYLYKSDGNINISHASIRDITASGGASFNAYNIADLGNNIGWDLLSGSDSRELYWVGGQGKWSEAQHWALSSNGAGGECVPTPHDDVVFDQYSFIQPGDSVLVDVRNAFCRSITWSEEVNSPIFYGDDFAALRIFGSMDLTKHMDFKFNGPLYFESPNTGNSISPDGVKFYNNSNHFYFDGVGGEWILKDSLDLGLSPSIRNNIQFINGTLKTNNQEISCYSFVSRVSNPRKLLLGGSTINVFNLFFMNGIGLELLADQSEINVVNGSFLHRNGIENKYHNVNFQAFDQTQRLTSLEADSLFFNQISFNGRGLLTGSNSYVLANKVEFLGKGQINTPDTSDINVYSFGELVFRSIGSIYGNDTCEQVIFDSTALVDGASVFKFAKLNDHGSLYGNSTFDSLVFQPGHIYSLEEMQVQTVNHFLDINGDNCNPIYLRSSGLEKAGLFKANDTVFGEFIEMYNIEASGGAYFDAGWFSSDINNSNVGWVFHDNPLQFKLDSVIYDIDKEVEICASNFNGNAGTRYIWQKYPEGDTLGYDSCFTLTPDKLGLFTLTVIYDEEGGCVRYDTLLWGCQYYVDLEKSNITCFGNQDGFIELDVQAGTGTEPFVVSWYNEEGLIGNSAKIDQLEIGEYNFVIEDGDGCSQSGSYVISQPDSLTVDFFVNYFTYFVDAIVEGGTHPYDFFWDSGNTASYEKVVESGRHTITVIDSNNCEIKSAIFIDLRYNIMAPNAFSPNNDGLNDEFVLYWQGPDIKYFLLEIYDRWGKKVFETTDADNYWTGKAFNVGDILPVGTYVWKLNVETVNSKNETDQGVINLIR